MAISFEELALGTLEGSAGPWTLAVGAGALAVMLAAGSARPLRRIATTGVVAAQRNGQLQLPGSMNMSITGWLGGVRQSWRDLVAEARAEYEASRKPAPLALDAGVPVVLKPEDRPAPPDVAAESRATFAVPDTAPADEPPVPPKRDRRGRFVRRQSPAARNNGTQSE